MFASALLLCVGVAAGSCDSYEEVPPKNLTEEYKLNAIVGSTPTADELTALQTIRDEYNNAVEN